MMKVAIPYWQGRVSPVFDVAGHLLVIEIVEGEELNRHQVNGSVGSPHMRAAQLSGLDVDVLICGAISWSMEAMVAQAGIEVISQICGEVECILGAFITGQLEQDTFRMPGCRGGGRRRQGGLCRRGGRNNEGLT